MPPSPTLPTRRRAARRLVPLLLVPLGLAGCGDRVADKFPPPCPRFGILPEGGDLQRWRGAGHDVTDQVLLAQVKGMDGTCKPGGPAVTAVSLSVRFAVDRGPAAPGRVADIPWFVAVTEGNQILDRQTYLLRAVFPPNTDQLALASDPITLKLPTSPKKTAVAYNVWVSFQLTPQDMAVNRANPLP